MTWQLKWWKVLYGTFCFTVTANNLALMEHMGTAHCNLQWPWQINGLHGKVGHVLNSHICYKTQTSHFFNVFYSSTWRSDECKMSWELPLYATQTAKSGHITHCHLQCKTMVTLKVHIQNASSKRLRPVVLP